MRFSRTPVIGLVAASGTGKTTLLKKLLPILRQRGLRPGYLKHAHHHFEIDQPGKDSYEIREAGAEQVLLASSARWALQGRLRVPGEDPPLSEMLEHFEHDRLDLILVEGFKFASFPKIELHRTTFDRPLLYPQDPDIIAVIADHSLPGDRHPPLLPPEDPEAIADFLLAYLSSTPPLGSRLRAEILHYYRQLRVYGCNDSHSGNASARAGETFWITPTGGGAESLAACELVRCPVAGDCPPGASLDAPLHQAVYRRNTAARALLHSHGPHAVAMSFAGQDFHPADFEGQSLFPRVPVLNIAYEHYLEQAPAAVAEILTGHPLCLVRGHGVYAWGETLEQAYRRTTALELSAKTFVIARQGAAF